MQTIPLNKKEKKAGKSLEEMFLQKRARKVPSKHRKRHSKSLTIRDMQMKTTATIASH